MSPRRWLRAHLEWQSPGPHQVNGSVPIGGAPAGHCGGARATALHQLGGFRDLLCEPGASQGDLPDEPEWLPELLDCADGYAMLSFLPIAPLGSWARTPGRRLTPPGVFCREGTSWGSACSHLPTYVPPSPRCRPEGAGQGACGLQGLPEQWAAGGTICQRASHLHHPAGSLHCQVQPRPAPGTAKAGTPSSPQSPAAHRSSELYESTLVVEGMLSEKACTLRLRGRGSFDERFVPPYQL